MPATVASHTTVTSEHGSSVIPVLLEGVPIDEQTSHGRDVGLTSSCSSGDLPQPSSCHKRFESTRLISSSSEESLSPSLERLSPLSDRRNIDIKTGSLLLVEFDKTGCELTSRVLVTVIGNSYEQHAQIYTDHSFNEQLGYISLRNCQVSLDELDPRIIYITLTNTLDCARTLKMIAKSTEDANEWVQALRPRKGLPRSSDCSPVGSPLLSRCFFATRCK